MKQELNFSEEEIHGEKTINICNQKNAYLGFIFYHKLLKEDVYTLVPSVEISVNCSKQLTDKLKELNKKGLR